MLPACADGHLYKEIISMTLLEQWRNKAYGDVLDARQRDQLWNTYFAIEKGIYEKILSDPSKVY